MTANVTEHIVSIALENDFDICFMMAQTQLETNFGLLGIGKSRKSMFGISKTYESYEICINDYVQTVQTKYLGSKKTHHHLMKNYVTLRGARYAENENYESELKHVYNHIYKHTAIAGLQKQIREIDVSSD
jgi:hypothetical protein